MKLDLSKPRPDTTDPYKNPALASLRGRKFAKDHGDLWYAPDRNPQVAEYSYPAIPYAAKSEEKTEAVALAVRACFERENIHVEAIAFGKPDIRERPAFFVLVAQDTSPKKIEKAIQKTNEASRKMQEEQEKKLKRGDRGIG